MHTVTVRHNFETAHRIPVLGGKCENLHGHSWWAEITVAAAALSPAGTVVEFGAFKKGVRQWIDVHLDHGTMLGAEDPLLPVLQAHGCKTHTVKGWPTVERVAALLADVAAAVLFTIDRAPGAHISRVRVSETHVNTATWEAPAGDPQ
ncbi:6-pyruvoyl trahydropterin synthase family protein [Streptomyces scabiei]|uniref:6-pyruvoyl trahydropterin synthase family protein n=1 Tax=Streptomyces scabiei TaxID=1930 RepID=UPI0038F7E4A3